MNLGNEKVAPGEKGDNLQNIRGVDNPILPDLDRLVSPAVAAEALPASERTAYRQGFQAGCGVALGAHDAIWQEGHVAGHEAGFAAGWRAGRANLLAEQDEAAQAAARAAAGPWLTGPTYWELAELRGEPERARRAYMRAVETGLVA